MPGVHVAASFFLSRCLSSSKEKYPPLRLPDMGSKVNKQTILIKMSEDPPSLTELGSHGGE
jgi:hypothetical protein